MERRLRLSQLDKAVLKILGAVFAIFYLVPFAFGAFATDPILHVPLYNLKLTLYDGAVLTGLIIFFGNLIRKYFMQLLEAL